MALNLNKARPGQRILFWIMTAVILALFFLPYLLDRAVRADAAGNASSMTNLNSEEQLRDLFEKDRGSVRLIALLSPG